MRWNIIRNIVQKSIFKIFNLQYFLYDIDTTTFSFSVHFSVNNYYNTILNYDNIGFSQHLY